MSLYEEFVKESEVPVIFADSSGIVTSINKCFEETFLWPAEKLVGRPLSMIIPKNLHDSHNLGFSKYIIGCKPSILNTPLELQIRLGNGDIISAEHFIVDFRDDGQELIAAKIIPR